MQKPISNKLRKAVLASFVKTSKTGFKAGKRAGEIFFTTPKGKTFIIKMTITDEDVYCHYPTNLGYDDWRMPIHSYYRIIGFKPR